MDPGSEQSGGEDLFQQVRWVQGLAFAILRDRQLAEDVSQEVLLRALAGEPRQGRVLKAWLAAVTKNLSFNARRDRLRRRAREEQAARPESAPPAKTPLEVLEAHRALTAAIAALPPDQREVVVLRFFENLGFADIAARLGIREDAARMRLHRALVGLRGELAARDRDWKTLCTLALPSSLVSSLQHPVPLSRIILMSAAASRLTTLVAILVLMLGGAAVWMRWDRGPERVSLPDAAELELPAYTVPDSSLTRAELALDQDGLQSSSALSDELPLEYQPHPEMRSGRVYYQGLPVSGAKIEARQAAKLYVTESDADGIFRLELDRYSQVWIEAAKGDLKGVGGDGWAGWPVQIELRVPPLKPRVLTIRDARTGLGIAGAHVDIVQLLYRLWQYGLPIDTHGKAVGTFATDADGRLDLDPLLRTGFLNFSVTAEGYLAYWGDADQDNGNLEIKLSPGIDPDLFLLATDGKPLSGAQVYIGEPATRTALTGSDGRVPGPIGWKPTRSRLRFPWMVVRLPSGRFWYLDDHESVASFASISPTRVEVRIEDLPVTSRLDGSLLPEGCWVEAARVDGVFETALLGQGVRDPGQIGTPMFLGSPWQRLEPGKWVALERGWAGPNIRVIARMQPAGLILGQFPVEAGRAEVLMPPLARLRMTINDLPDYGDGGWFLDLLEADRRLFDDDHGVYLAHPTISADGSFEQWTSPGRYSIDLRHSRWPVRYYWDDGVMRPGIPPDRGACAITLAEGETVLEGRAESGSWQKVRILVDGHPVHGGNLSSSRIDPDGWTALRVDPNGEVQLRWPCTLKVPAEVGMAVERPVHTIRSLPPRSVMRVTAGDPLTLDFKLTSIFLDAHGIDLSKSYHLTIKPLPCELESTGGMEQAQFGIRDSRYPFPEDGHGYLQIDYRSFGWEFRVPEGTYSVALVDQATSSLIWLTSQDGQSFPAGTQTVLSRQD